MILGIAKDLLEAEEKQREEDRIHYMEEKCPPLSLPGSVQELQVHRHKMIIIICIMSILYIIIDYYTLYNVYNEYFTLLLNVLSNVVRICANSFISRLMWWTRRDMTCLLKWPKVTKRFLIHGLFSFIPLSMLRV